MRPLISYLAAPIEVRPTPLILLPAVVDTSRKTAPLEVAREEEEAASAEALIPLPAQGATNLRDPRAIRL